MEDGAGTLSRLTRRKRSLRGPGRRVTQFCRWPQEERNRCTAALASLVEGYRIVEAPADLPIGNVTLAQLMGSTGKARVLLLSPRPGYKPLLTFKSFLQPETRGYRSVILLGAESELGVAQRFYLIHELCHATVPGHVREFLSTKAIYGLILLYVPILLACQHWLARAAIAVLLAYHLLNAKENLGIELDIPYSGRLLVARQPQV
jgi:hypothetical protein